MGFLGVEFWGLGLGTHAAEDRAAILRLRRSPPTHAGSFGFRHTQGGALGFRLVQAFSLRGWRQDYGYLAYRSSDRLVTQLIGSYNVLREAG